MNKALNEAIKNLSIVIVTLQESSVSLHEEIDCDEIPDISSVRQSFRNVRRIREASFSAVDGDETEKEFYEYNFLYGVGVRLIKERDSDAETEKESSNVEPIVEITATFNVRYTSAAKLSQEAIMAFSENNVGYHVWPYWREFVQTNCARMNIPLFEMPFYICESKGDSAE